MEMNEKEYALLEKIRERNELTAKHSILFEEHHNIEVELNDLGSRIMNLNNEITQLSREIY